MLLMSQDTATTGQIGGKWWGQSTGSPQDPHYPIIYVRHRGPMCTVVSTVKNNPTCVVLCVVIDLRKTKNIYTTKPKSPQLREAALLKKENPRAHYILFFCPVTSVPMSQLFVRLPEQGKK